MHFFQKNKIYYNISHKNKLKNAPITTKQLILYDLETFNARTQFYKKIKKMKKICFLQHFKIDFTLSHKNGAN